MQEVREKTMLIDATGHNQHETIRAGDADLPPLTDEHCFSAGQQTLLMQGFPAAQHWFVLQTLTVEQQLPDRHCWPLAHACRQ